MQSLATRCADRQAGVRAECSELGQATWLTDVCSGLVSEDSSRSLTQGPKVGSEYAWAALTLQAPQAPVTARPWNRRGCRSGVTRAASAETPDVVRDLGWVVPRLLGDERCRCRDINCGSVLGPSGCAELLPLAGGAVLRALEVTCRARRKRSVEARRKSAWGMSISLDGLSRDVGSRVRFDL